MKREHQRVGLGGVLLGGLVGAGALAACSAGGSGENGSGLGAGSTGNGNTGNVGGYILGAGNTNQGGVNGTGSFLNLGGDGNPGGAGSVGGGSNAPTGPQNIDRCTDPGRFQGATPGNMRLLYPYEGTVFPRGIAAPPIMWDGASPTEILVEFRSNRFTYRECVTVADAGRFLIPQDAWDGAGGWSEGTGDPLHVTISAITGGQVISVTRDLLFALATMKGAIYYNTYDSPLAANNGAVMKTLPSATAPTVFLTVAGIPPLGPCISCHALSANGATMTANHHAYPAGPYVSNGYDVAAGTAVPVSQNIPESGFAGIFPDGSRMLTNGPPNATVSIFFPTAPGNVAALQQAESKLLDIQGNVIPSNWDVPHAQMPMFSPDGRRVVYNDHDNGAGHSLWVAEFDAASNTFSSKREVFNDPARFPSWPFFTPDGNQVVFALGTNNEFVSQLPDPLLATALMRPVTRGSLRIVDVNTRQSVPLDQANGFRNGQSYLPDSDNDYEYFTTMSPVSAGGFYWSLFTSRRTYGNMIQRGKEDPKSKKIWVSAISIGAAPGTDPSHPAFLLPGQELESGNVRAFAALEPCKEDGASCTSGTDCCSGYCNNIDPVTGIGRCGTVTLDECSKLDNRCAADADCCTGADNGASGRTLRCLGNYCGQILL